MKTHLHIAIIAVSASLLLLTSAFAQAPSPTASVITTNVPFKMPDMGVMYSQMMNAMYSELIRPERAAQLAHFQKQYYDALLKEGFTKEEALNIMRGTQLPMLGAK